MWRRNLLISVLIVLAQTSGSSLANGPTADITGDGIVDSEDLSVLMSQWLSGDRNNYLVMVSIPAGEFEMGDHHGDGFAGELPLHLVTLDPFFLGKYEVTNKQFCDYLNSAEDSGEIKVVGGVVYATADPNNTIPYCSTSSAPAGSPDYGEFSQIDYAGGVFSVRTKSGRDMSNDPMMVVSWYGAAAYCNWRSSDEGKEPCYSLSTWSCDIGKKGYRLPTEAEWEYAARGGSHNPYYRFDWGDTISHTQANYYSHWTGGTPGNPFYPYDVNPTREYHANWNDGIFPYTATVGSFSANGYDLYDMAGNVAEWCNDWYDSNYYNVSPSDNPQGPDSGTFRILRGGSWSSYAAYCRVASRSVNFPNNRYSHTGFRVALHFEATAIPSGDGATPSADLTGDGFVDLADIAVMADQWLTGKREVVQ